MYGKSIGIIGVADGPTSIYISTSVNWSLYIGIGALIAWKKKHK